MDLSFIAGVITGIGIGIAAGVAYLVPTLNRSTAEVRRLTAALVEAASKMQVASEMIRRLSSSANEAMRGRSPPQRMREPSKLEGTTPRPRDEVVDVSREYGSSNLVTGMVIGSLLSSGDKPAPAAPVCSPSEPAPDTSSSSTSYDSGSSSCGSDSGGGGSD